MGFAKTVQCLHKGFIHAHVVQGGVPATCLMVDRINSGCSVFGTTPPDGWARSRSRFLEVERNTVDQAVPGMAQDHGIAFTRGGGRYYGGPK